MTDVRMADPMIAQAAYQAYGWFRGHMTHDGKPMPPWQGLPREIQDAWRVACATAIQADKDMTSHGAG